MNRSQKEFFTKYKSLKEEIEKHSEKLGKAHSQHMKCKKGCSMCCMDYSIFPIEFHFILNEIKEKKIEYRYNQNVKNEVCVFLQEDVCTIYHQRPIICRTHGLPLLYMNDGSEWELSACDLNFKEFDFHNFTLDNTYPQDKYNSKLFMLNQEFITSFKELNYKETDLLPIKELLNQLK